MRRIFVLVAVLGAAPEIARAQDAPPVATAPADQPMASPVPPPTPAAEAAPPPLAPAVEASPAPLPEARRADGPAPLVLTERRPRFFAGALQITARAAAGFEPHPDFHCKATDPTGMLRVSSTCTVTSFAVGGELLWRGIVGASLGVWASEGSPLIPDGNSLGIGDRVSVSLAALVRPFAPLAWKRGDRWSSRLLAGIGIEAGPSVEYLRSSGIEIKGCAIPVSQVQPGFSGALHVEVPLLGDTKSGWLSLRVTERLVVNAESQLAPSSPSDCHALIVNPGIVTQTFFGLAYSI